MPALRPALAAGALAAVLALGALSVPLVLHGFPGAADEGVRAADLENLVGARLPPPPTLRLLTPEPAQGVGPTLRVSGEAAAERSAILDVQYRLDGGPWASLPGVVAGAALAPFSAQVPLAPGDHLLEVRAYDGNAFSLPARAHVRAAPTPPPTVRILAPADGQGVPLGPLVVSGTLDAPAAAPTPRVVVRAAGHEATALVTPGPGGAAAWTATVTIPPGEHEVEAQADGGLPARARVAAASMPPPTLRVLQPAPGASFGSGGVDACRCVPFAGVAPGAESILASLDGGEPQAVRLDAAGAWTWTVPVTQLLSGEHQAAFTPVGAGGARGVTRHVDFHVRTLTTVQVVGDDAPQPTHTRLRFEARGDHVRGAAWTLDGAPAGTGHAVDVTLTAPGLHVLGARTTDAQGRVATLRVPLWALNRLPNATLVPPSEPVEGEARLLAFGADADGAIVSWRWDLGDGTTRATAEGVLTHRWPHAGTFHVRATPVDDQGAAGPAAAGAVTVLNGLPQAGFVVSPDPPTLHDVVTFTDASADPEHRLATARWTFGDGHAAEGRVVTHRYATRGPHPVTLTVTDADGGVARATRLLTLDNLLPRAAFLHDPQAIATGVEALFVDRSADPDGHLVSRAWDFGHGCAAPCDPLRARHANGSAVLHVFPAPGTYRVTLAITDDAGATALRALDVLVHDALPKVRKVTLAPEIPHARQAIRFNATVHDAEGGPVSLAWDFGDGNASTDSAPTHAYARSGLYQPRVTARDAAGQETTLAFPVLVHNAKPNVTLRLLQPAFAGHPVHLDALALDPDGRAVRFRFDADGDGGAECDGPAARCTFTWPAPGRYDASVSVMDDEGASVRAELAVDVAAPPGLLAPPAVTVEAPLPNATLAGRVMLVGSAHGLAAIDRVEVQLRNASWTFSAAREPWMLASGNASWRLPLDTRAFGDGEYDLVVRATDARGAAGAVHVPILVQNEARPSLVSVTIHNPPSAPLRADHDLLGSAWHPDGPVTVRWRLDGGPWRDVSGDPVGFTLTLRPAELGPGPHVLEVSAHRGPRESATETLRFRVADAPPVLVVDEPPHPLAYGLLAASGRLQGEGRVLWRLDHDVWRELPTGPQWRLAVETQGLRAGPRDLWLKPVSLDGVEEGPPVKYRVRIINPHGATEEDRRLLEESRKPTPLPGEVDLEEEARKQTPVGALALVAGAALLASLATSRRRRG